MISKTLESKKVIIVGGSSGIGLAVAKMAYESGAIVTITSRNLNRAVSVAASIGPTVKGMAVDVDEEDSVNTMFSSFTAIDHIYVAAGSTKICSVTNGSLEENMKSFNTRLLGSLRIVRAVANKINDTGSITFTGGISTARPIAGAWVSGLATASAEQLARVLVMEFPAIRFNAVSPGYTDTAMWNEVLGDSRTAVLAGVAEKLPVKKIASAEEVASAVLFLISNASVTGEVIHVDGGGRLI